MKKGINKIILLYISALIIIMPFSFCNNIYAESVPSNNFILGVNIYKVFQHENQVISSLYQSNWSSSSIENSTNDYLTCGSVQNGVCQRYNLSFNGNYTTYYDDINLSANGTVNQWQSYKYDFVLNNHYVGSVDINNTTYYVNGTVLSFQEYSYRNSFTISNINLTKYSDINNEPIIDNWSFPIESYTFINHFFSRGFTNQGINSLNNYNYPIFRLYVNDSFNTIRTTSENSYVLILGINKNVYNSSTFLTYFSLDNGTISSFENIFRTDYNGSFSIIKLIINKPATNNILSPVLTALQNVNIIPIYFNYSNIKNISNDFALNYNLTNKYLDNIQNISNTNTSIDNKMTTNNNSLNSIDNKMTLNNQFLDRLVNGVNSTNNSVNNANNMNNQLDSSNNNYQNIDDQLTGNLDNNLQNINTNLNVNNLSGFVYGANWVKTQFDYMSNNFEPVQLIVTYSLILGLAMLLIGKRLL